MKAPYSHMSESPHGLSRSVLLTLGLVLCCGAVSLASFTAQASAADEDDAKFQRDRQAILAMAGNYHVSFHFEETVSFVEGYELKKPYEPEGYEIVRVIRDEGDFISLQHILVVEGIWEKYMPIKHWRQDWIYEPNRIFEYVGHNVWKARQLNDSEIRGKWAQLVYQVDDSPRYAAVAEWKHQHGVSSWTSPPTWRPLPRREASKRDDYNVLVSENRHALTPNGWVHEQESSKLILGEEPQILAREQGLNTYTASNDFKIEVAEDYWEATKLFWAEVRPEWKRLHNEFDTFRVSTRSESGKLYNRILNLAKDIRKGEIEMEAAVSRARDIIDASTTTNVAEIESHVAAKNVETSY